MRRVRLLTAEAALSAARASVPVWPKHNMLAMYSSSLGGIVTDPFMMFVPIDDHLIHRGHCVFDTANVHEGRVYGLAFHLDRLYRSAEQARIERLPPRAEVKDAILATVAATGSGPAPGASFYVVVHRAAPKALDTPGVAEVTVKVPLKTQLLATMKSNNYLLNALTAMEAEDKGGSLGLQVDEDGCVMESSIACVAIVTPDGLLKAPPFDHTLSSTTLIRAFELAREKMIQPGGAPGDLADVVQAPTALSEAYTASEMLSLGGGGVVPIVSLDGNIIGDGKPGPVFRRLWTLLHDDLSNPELTDEVPYEAWAPGTVGLSRREVDAG